MTELEKKIISLQEKIFSLNFDISKSFLPESEIVKNIISNKNINFSKAEIDIMIDGKVSEVTKRAMMAESIAQQGVNSVTTFGKELTTDLKGNTFHTGNISNLDLNIDPSKINTQGQIEISSTVNQAQTTLDQFINSGQAALQQNQSALTQAQVQLNQQFANLENIAKLAKSKNVYPLPKSSPFYVEARKLKTEVRKSTMLFIKEQKELIQELSRSAIDSVNSISGAVVLIAPPSFNVPAALVLVLKVIDSISKIISKMMSAVTHLEPLKDLSFLLPKETFTQATAPITTSLKVMLDSLGIITTLQKLISSLMSRLRNITNPQNLGSQIDKLRAEIFRVEKELEQLQEIEDLPIDILDKKKEELNELRERLDTLLAGPNLPPMDDLGQFQERSINEILVSIDSSLATQAADLTDLNIQFFDYLYDIELPDGSLVVDVKEEELEEYKQKYNVIFNNLNSD